MSAKRGKAKKPATGAKTSVIRARCTAALEERLHNFCAAFGVDLSDVIRLATTAYMDAEERRRTNASLAQTIADVSSIDPQLADQLRQRVAGQIEGGLRPVSP